MADFLVDKRDLEFALFDHLNLASVCTLDRYKEMDRQTFEMILQEAIKFSGEVLKPIRAASEEEGSRLVDGQVIMPKVFGPAYKKFIEGGWLAPVSDMEFGGMGLPQALGMAILELLTAANVSFVLAPGLCTAAGHVLIEYGTDIQRDAAGRRLFNGEWTGTMCLTEPCAGSDVGALTTTATPIEGTDEYSIVGNKIFITGGDQDLTSNVIHLVLARIPGDPPGTKGISLFMVPKIRFDASGRLGERNDVEIVALEKKMGIHGSATCAISFGPNEQCRGTLIGERCRGIVHMFHMMNEERLAVGCQGVSAANASYQLALAYAKERVQSIQYGDRSPDAKPVTIINHPDVRRNLMLAKSLSEGIRALLFTTAMYNDLAAHHPDEAIRTKNKDLVDFLTPICKAYATDAGFEVTELAIQIHGGYGYCDEYEVEGYMRDVKIASIYEGTNGIQALDLLGRKMRMKSGGLFQTWLGEFGAAIAAASDQPSLADLCSDLNAAKTAVLATAMHLAGSGKADPEATLLGATPYLELVGHIELSRLLVEQATIAAKKLAALVGGKDLAQEIEHNEEARYLDAKVKTARFFVRNVLPKVHSLAATIQAGDRTALDVRL